jgi:ATP-dependent Clp protease ATP-binding subunit ClpA
MSTFSRNLEHSLHRALAAANQRQYEYATLEHLLLALTDDEDASTVMRACNVDLEKLRRDLVACIESELENPVTDGSDAKPTENFQRVIQHAATHVESVGREEVTGADVLVAILAERESRAVDFLQQHQGATRYELTRYISYGIGRDRVALDRKGGDGPTQHTGFGHPSRINGASAAPQR